MNKYFSIAKISLLGYLAYRMNFILWRFRSVLSILLTYFLWQSVYANTNNIFGYSKFQMLSYIILINLISSIAQSTQTFRIAEEINYGTLSVILLKPINYFAYNVSRDISDKIINFFSSVIEIFILVIILKVPLYVQTDILLLFLFIIACFISSILFFEINVLLSFIGFWSKDTWAPRFVFYILVAFLAGGYFPLDIFSGIVYKIISFLPFTYLIFFPLKIYLGNYNLSSMIFGFEISLIWILILLFSVIFIWRKGLKIYTSEGS
jgi:ABC-2 type transport system permease protein